MTFKNKYVCKTKNFDSPRSHKLRKEVYLVFKYVLKITPEKTLHYLKYFYRF